MAPGTSRGQGLRRRQAGGLAHQLLGGVALAPLRFDLTDFDSDTLEQAQGRVSRLGTVVQPVAGALNVDLQRGVGRVTGVVVTK